MKARGLSSSSWRLFPALLVAALTVVNLGCDRRERSNPFDPLNPGTGGVPALLQAVAGDGTVELSWSFSGLAVPQETRILRTSAGGPETILAAMEGDGPGRYTDEFLENGLTQSYRLEVLPVRGERLYTASSLATPGGSEPWVADGSGSGIARLSPDGRVVLFRTGDFRSILDMEFEADGSFWAADYTDGTVLRYGPDGTPLISWDEYGANALAIDQVSRRIWVGSFNLGAVALFERNGTPVWSDSTVGFVEEIDAAPDGGIWVASREGGVYRVRAGTPPRRVDGITWAVDVETEDDGRAWIVDRQQAGIFRVTPDGLNLERASASFQNPTVLSLDGEGGAFVADQGRGGIVHLDSDLRESGFFPLGPVESVTWDPVSRRLWMTYGAEGRIEVAGILYRPEGAEEARVSVSLRLGGRPVQVEGIWRP